jgi:hypothetical protein
VQLEAYSSSIHNNKHNTQNENAHTKTKTETIQEASTPRQSGVI